ncbi:hypothetical protein ACKWTF_014435 [Chironomus riparius]
MRDELYNLLKNHSGKINRKHTFIVITIITLVFIIINYLILFKHYKTTEIKVHNSPKNESLRYILFWTKFFETENWGMGKKVLGEEFLKSMQCSVTNCIFSHDRGLLSSPADYDALIFHVGEPFDIYDLPATRSENQIYAMLNQESPIYTWHNFEHDKGFFDMTVTYRQDSDVYFGYSKMVEISSNLIVSPSKEHVWREPETVNDPQILNLIASKSKMAAWFVSRCGTNFIWRLKTQFVLIILPKRLS